MRSGIYIVTLNNDQPISVNANDPRIADKAIKVNNKNCKVGKAQDLYRREKNYCKVFGADNMNFTVIVTMRDIDEAEKTILSRLDKYRIRGRTGRRNEWLQDIEPEEVKSTVLEELERLGLPYELVQKPGSIWERMQDFEPEVLTPCVTCVHRISGFTCEAFPRGIPESILTGEHLHREPFPGDRGIQYKAAT